jgi:hypothetical protein
MVGITRLPCSDVPVTASEAWHRFRVEAERQPSQVLAGLHHRNYVAPLWDELAQDAELPADALAKVRIRAGEEDNCDLRVWPGEIVLDHLAGSVADAPRVLARDAGFTVQTFTVGKPLSFYSDYGAEVDDTSLKGIADLFRQLATVPLDGLPAVPVDWPASGDCEGFLRRLVVEAKKRSSAFEVHYGSLFRSLGIPVDAWERFDRRFGRRTGSPVRRPFVLLHTDIHRGNIIVTRDSGGGRMSLIDWELAMIGDPLCELANHICRMHYSTTREREAVEQYWAEALTDVRPGAVEGMRSDLPAYLGLERLQSVYNDTVRAAKLVRRSPAKLGNACGRVLQTIEDARSLGVMDGIATAVQVRDALESHREGA